MGGRKWVSELGFTYAMYGALYSAGSKSAHVCMLSCVRLFATPWTVAWKAHLSMKRSRQGYWSGLPFPSPGDLPDPGMEVASPEFPAFFATEPPGKPRGKRTICIVFVAQWCPTLCDPMDCSPQVSSLHGILQARMLEWVAISFSSDLYIREE